MALIKCKECGKEISDKAVTCPNCGTPVSNVQNNISQPSSNQPNKNSSLGVVALILSIIGCTFIFGVVLAIIDLCKKDGKKKTCSIIALAICGVWFIIGVSANIGKDKSDNSTQQVNVQSDIEAESVAQSKVEEPKIEEKKVEEEKAEEKDKYNVGDTWESKTLKVDYIDCYEFSDYNQFNAPADGNKIICAEFEFENIGKSDTTVMYTDFHGYADGYEVNQSYAPDGTGLDFSVKMSAGRKGTGKVAFEVPQDAVEIEIEFSPNLWTSEKVVFVYE